MTEKILNQGGFTLPGEAGYEQLTMDLAQQWGADAIRDSDGTVLSDKITEAGFDIYSTLCLVRIDNQWAKANPDKIQQNYLMSQPVVAKGDSVTIDLLDGFFREQFSVNAHDDPKQWWQVFDRTTGEEVPAQAWRFDAGKGTVAVLHTKKWHKYTVNFLAYRIWEDISMYNHITNDWGDREHLMPIDPIYPETQALILEYLQQWLDSHLRTKVVRFTSMFYNFAWFWGDSPDLRFRYVDWGSCETTVSPYALSQFAAARGYALTSEDFVNKGAYCSSHNVPSERLLDWMDFMNEFVVSFGKQCIDKIHAAGKHAYMFYDDHIVGTEPYGDRFKDFGFDGLIKCVFNAFEARLCAGAKGVKTKELRLHPYLFPTGLRGEPTFTEGGDPAQDAKRFWVNIRRGLLREPVDRIGLGGYLHLVEKFPDFVEAVKQITEEFRTIRHLHENDRPYTAPVKAAVLTAWGKLRSWVYVGHFIHGMELYEVTESLAGLPVNVEFISYDDIVNKGIPDDVHVILNAGRLDTAWCGGKHWENEKVIEILSSWVADGGGFIGIGEPSACLHSSQYFQLSEVLGVDRQTSQNFGNPRRQYTLAGAKHFILEDAAGTIDFGDDIDDIYIIGKDTQVLVDNHNSPQITTHPFGRGRAIYLSGFKFTAENSRLLHRALFWAAGKESLFGPWTCSNILTDCVWFENSQKMVVINSSDNREETNVSGSDGAGITVRIEPYSMKVMDKPAQRLAFNGVERGLL
jgi:beta-D-galactosyl-(1->4)-L-rhamnose phosphorylase